VARVVFDGVTKVYPGAVVAVDDLTLEVADGEFLILVGPSGCGKSTALRMVAGLERISAGTITIGDRVVNDVPPKDRDIAMVFQNYALYPHMTVYENMAFALKVRKTPKAEADRRVREAAGRVRALRATLDRTWNVLGGPASGTRRGAPEPRERARLLAFPFRREWGVPRGTAPLPTCPERAGGRSKPKPARQHTHGSRRPSG
jgi:ABC-type taurine transport system ATPase subunit